MALQVMGVPFSIIEFLLSHNTKINLNDLGGYTHRIEPTLIEPLYEHVDLARRNQSGLTALHLAIRSDHIEGVRRLLRRGADVNQKTSNLLASTPLHIAAEYASSQCVELLLQHGADVNTRDALNNSALTRVVTYHPFYTTPGSSSQSNKIELLLEYGADLDDVLLKAWLFEASEESLKIMVRHMALRDQERAKVRNDSMLPFSDPELYSLYVGCQEEAAQMHKYIIFHDLSVYQFLKRDSRDLLRYVRNNAFKSCLLRNQKLKANFPNYYEMLVKRYQVMCKRNKIFVEATKSLEIIFGFLYDNHLVTERIVACLSIQDTWNVIYAAGDIMKNDS